MNISTPPSLPCHRENNRIWNLKQWKPPFLLTSLPPFHGDDIFEWSLRNSRHILTKMKNPTDPSAAHQAYTFWWNKAKELLEENTHGTITWENVEAFIKKILVHFYYFLHVLINLFTFLFILSHLSCIFPVKRCFRAGVGSGLQTWWLLFVLSVLLLCVFCLKNFLSREYNGLEFIGQMLLHSWPR